MNGSGLGPLSDGGCAVVVGGGPSGAAAALALKQGAQELGRSIRVVVLEGKRFEGAQHHNQCVGVLSPPIIELLTECLEVPFPHHLVRGLVTDYVLHTPRRQIILHGHAEPSVVLRRVQFDAYMLEVVRQRGIEVMPSRVTGIEIYADGVQVYTESEPLQADVVVGAFGLDEGSAVVFQRATGYRPPAALDSVVTKYHPGEAGMNVFGYRIHAFLLAMTGIEFGAVTPKGNHLTINIGGRVVNAEHMSAFLAHPAVRMVLPDFQNAGRFEPADLRFYKGHFPCGLASYSSGDRFVMVGDAAGLVRAFKGKGVTSALQTGMRAAEVILKYGISNQAFQLYQAANQDIVSDMPYGMAVRYFTILGTRLGLMDALARAAERDIGLNRALFDAVSAHRAYRQVLKEGINPPAVWKVLRAWV